VKQVVIVGGGLVGSLLAYRLAKKGFQVDVYERRSDMRLGGYQGGRSINLVLSYRGLASLRAAGLEAEILPLTVPAYGRMIHTPTGEQQFYPYSIHQQAIYSVSRGQLNQKLMTLAEALPNVRFHFNQRCADVDLETGTAWFQHAETGLTIEVKSDLLVGTDGAFSAVRQKMTQQSRFNYSQEYIEHGYKEIHIPAAADGSPQLDTSALHIWPRRQFMLMGLANTDHGFTGTLFFPFEGEESFETIQTPAQVQALFHKHFSDATALVPDYVEQYFNNPTSSLVIVRCSPWYHGTKVMLMGDAAHAIVPFYGEGMNAGFEDVQVFVDLLDQHAHDQGLLLREYHRLRKPNGDAIADLSLRNFVEMRDLVADPRFVLRKKIEAEIQRKYPEQWTPLYSQVKFSTIPYLDAWNEGLRQDRIMEPILNLQDIEKRWNSPEVEQAILSALASK
jgi:kynurenine 3-monooxygenase